MIEQNAVKPVRKVAVADHIWDAFEQMAREMGSDRDASINQAMHMSARLNGFLSQPGGPASKGASSPMRAPVREVPPPKAEDSGEAQIPDESGDDLERRPSPSKLFGGGDSKPPPPSDDDPR